MKLIAVAAIILAFVIGATSLSLGANRCSTGTVRGFAVVRGDPTIGIGSLPSIFSGQQELFEVRYNCSGKGVLAKRVDEGIYDVWFPSNPAKVAVVSAMNQQAASASVDRIDDGIFRISIRGPVVNNDILIHRELPFYIAIF